MPWLHFDLARVQRTPTSHSTGWVIAGSSAGAETALWSGYVDAPDRWKGVVSYSGALDAATRPSSASPPLFALHGTCDVLVPIGADIHHFCPEDEMAPGPSSVVPRGRTLSAPQD